jgi:WD40 repeat protein
MATRDGRRLATSVHGGPTVIRDARTLRALAHLPVGAGQAALAPDDRTMLLGGRDGAVRFVDLETGRVRTASGRHDGAIAHVAFSADGRLAVTAGEDNRVIVWDVKRATARETLEGHAGRISGLAISRDGATLYTAALDGKVLMWDLSGARRLGRPFDIGPGSRGGRPIDPLPRSAMRPDGRMLAVGHDDGTVALIDTRSLRTVSRFRAVPKGRPVGMAYSPDGRLLVVGGEHGYLGLFDPSRGKLVRALPGHRGAVMTPSFSADGRLMATTSIGDTVLLWTMESGRPVGRPRTYSTSGPRDVSLSPDGRTLAVTAVGVEVVDVATLRRSRLLPGSGTVISHARFTPDGRFVVAGSFEGWARLWSTETWRPATRALAGHTEPVLWQSTSPDGRTLATGGADGTIRLFDLGTQQPLGVPLRGVANHPVFPEFTADGAYLFATTRRGRAYRWDVRPSTWARHACEVAGRTLTRTEWNDALPGRDYAPACARRLR